MVHSQMKYEWKISMLEISEWMHNVCSMYCMCVMMFERKYLSPSLINIVLTWLKRIWNLNVLYLLATVQWKLFQKTENLFLPATIQTLDYYNGLECQEFISRGVSLIHRLLDWNRSSKPTRHKKKAEELKDFIVV